MKIPRCHRQIAEQGGQIREALRDDVLHVAFTL
jgi:hypothetical protein